MKARYAKRICPVCRRSVKVDVKNGCTVVRHPSQWHGRGDCAGTGRVDLGAAETIA